MFFERRPGGAFPLAALLAGLVFGALAGRVPLLDGLTYEYAVAVAVAVFLAGILLGSRAARQLVRPYGLRWNQLDATPRERLEPVLRRAGLALVTAALAAMVSPALHGHAGGCRWERGVGLYLLVTLPAVPLGLAIGAFARAAVPGRRWARRGLIAALVTTLVGLTVYEVVAGPRAVFHNLVIGIVSNTAYLGLDETVRVTVHDVFHRSAALVLAALLVTLALERAAARAVASPEAEPGRVAQLSRGERRSALRRMAVIGSLLAAMVAMGDRFGFGSGAVRVERALAASVATDHFVLRYRAGSRVEALAAQLAADCEWAHDRLVSRLSLDRAVGDRIVVWVYADEREQRELTGASGYLFAKPWLGEIHTQLGPGGRLVALEHEIVHVLAARFGLPLLRVSTRYGLIEGLAEGVAGEYDTRPWRHEPVAAALDAGLLPSARQLLGTLGFATLESRTSYLSAASFCGFLLARYGPEPLRAVYARGDFERVYRRSIDALDAEWRAFLRDVPVGARAAAFSERAFDRELSPPFFRKACARLGRRAGAATAAVVTADPAVVRARELSDFDRRAATGPLLGRDAALAALAARLARAERFEEAAAVLWRRRQLGVAAPAVQRALEVASRDRLAAILTLTTGHAPSELSGDESRLAALARALLEEAPLDVVVDAAFGIGGCGAGLAELESLYLLRVARAARRDDRNTDAIELASRAYAIAPASSDVRFDAALEIERATRRSREPSSF